MTGEEGIATAPDRVHADRILWASRAGIPLGPNVAEDLPRYREWVQGRQAARLLGRVRDERSLVRGPELTVVVLVHPEMAAGPLRNCLRSISEQTVTSWRVSVAVLGSSQHEVDAVLGSELPALPGGRVDVRRFPEASGAVAARATVEGSASPAFLVLAGSDALAPDALALLSEALVEADIAYADEDRFDRDGLARDPALKPDWSAELLLAWNYVGRPVAFRRAPVEAAGGIREVEGDWEHDLVLRVTEHTERIAHVPEILCHHGADDPVTAPASPAVVAAALARRGEGATVEPGPLPLTWRVRRHAGERPPTVTAIVPFRDAPVLLRNCVDSLRTTTSDVDLQLLLVDNGSEELETLTLLDRIGGRPDVTVVSDPRPFNWAALNNGAVDAARGEVLLFLNNDVVAVRPGWLGSLARQALRPVVGAAGARLLYPDGYLQHAGMVVGLGGAAGHVLAGLDAALPGYLGMAVLARDCTAVTGACMATRRELFEQVGGFDQALGLDLNDVDYCLRLRERGLRIVYEPGAELIHHESPTRGTSGSTADQARFLHRWEDVLRRGDPFLNAHLTRADGSASLRVPHEEEAWDRWRRNLIPNLKQ